MKCQALTKEEKTRAYFEIKKVSENGIYLKAPNGVEYYLIFEQVLEALGFDLSEKNLDEKEEK